MTPPFLHFPSVTETYLALFFFLLILFSNLMCLQHLPILHFLGLFMVTSFKSCQNQMVTHNHFIPWILLPCHWRKSDWFDSLVWCICQLLLITFTSFAYRWVEYCSLSIWPSISLSAILPCLKIRYYIPPFPAF